MLVVQLPIHEASGLGIFQSQKGPVMGELYYSPVPSLRQRELWQGLGTGPALGLKPKGPIKILNGYYEVFPI